MELRRAAEERRVLLVDDDTELRMSLADLLHNDGFRVWSAANGQEALAHLHGSSLPDVILLDLMMPVKDGWQFRIEQKQDPAISSIPVLAMSADDTAKAAAIDADYYLKKPFEYSVLLDALHRIIETKRLAHLDRMASLGTLAAGIAHEINNPLTYVIANLQLLEEEIPRVFQDSLNAVQKAEGAQPPPHLAGAINRLSELGARLRDALDGAERIRSIVLHVKTFSRAGDEHRVLVDVRSILDSSIKVVLNEIRQRARLSKEFGHTPLVHANPGQLGQVFLNLLLNAAHAIREEDPNRNLIRVSTFTSPAGQVVVEIADSGAGIPADIRHRIFDPFFTTKPLGVGTGLGLSICHGIVRSLDGSISVDSEVGKGSTFRIVLPACPPEEILASQPASSSAPCVRRGKVLIVDDEPRVATALRAMIETEHETLIALTGAEALEVLDRDEADDSFDIILCDLHMPDMSGMELHARLTSTRPAVAQRIVFMTGGAFTERARDFLARTTNPCIEKPLGLEALRSLVARKVRERR